MVYINKKMNTTTLMVLKSFPKEITGSEDGTRRTRLTGWDMGEAVLEAEEYEYSNFYVNNRFLENKSWDAWTFSPINSTETNTTPRPELLKAAPNN